MKRRNHASAAVAAALLAAGLATAFGCSKEIFFRQPELRVLAAELLELPADRTSLSLTVQVSNTDRRGATVEQIRYTVLFPDDDVTSEQMTCEQAFALAGRDTVTLTVPLTVSTAGAARLLARLVDGEALAYRVQGEFLIDVPVLGSLALPLDFTGAATVAAGYESFFEQPAVTVDAWDITGFAGFPPTAVSMAADITVTNRSPYGATITEVRYLVRINGTDATQHETCGEEFSIGPYDNDPAGGPDTVALAGMPFTMPAAIAALLNGSPGQILTVSYEVTGTFHATAVLGGGEQSFYLPLHATGTADIITP